MVLISPPRGKIDYKKRKLVSIVLFSISAGTLFSALEFASTLHWYPIEITLNGVAMAAIVGGFVGGIAVPIIAPLLFKRDLRIARPLVIFTTSIVIIIGGHVFHAIFWPAIISFIVTSLFVFMATPHYWEEPDYATDAVTIYAAHSNPTGVLSAELNSVINHGSLNP